ncbi:hypothetical protein [Streptomyces sp. NPDC058249]|uniref:hypothetical protein n=1 Tax=Streptomyces sp. NPDC058249 TaxID=3346403 RepID=UPI0036E235B2
MRAIPMASAVLPAVAVLTFAAPAPAAVADDGGGNGHANGNGNGTSTGTGTGTGTGNHNVTPFGYSVEPSAISAGGQISLLLKRDGGCKSRATVSSGVFETVTISPGQSSARATVDWDAKAGAVYEVTFVCDGVRGHTELTIAPGRSDDGRTPPDLTPAAVPVERGVRAGVGGSVGGFDLKEIGLGAALIGGSVGTAWHLSRRRGADDDS